MEKYVSRWDAFSHLGKEQHLQKNPLFLAIFNFLPKYTIFANNCSVYLYQSRPSGRFLLPGLRRWCKYILRKKSTGHLSGWWRASRGLSITTAKLPEQMKIAGPAGHTGPDGRTASANIRSAPSLPDAVPQEQAPEEGWRKTNISRQDKRRRLNDKA